MVTRETKVTDSRVCSAHILDDLSILIPFNSFFWGRKHRVGFFGLFEEAAFATSFPFHHEIVLCFMSRRLVDIFLHVTLIAGVDVCPRFGNTTGS